MGKLRVRRLHMNGALNWYQAVLQEEFFSKHLASPALIALAEDRLKELQQTKQRTEKEEAWKVPVILMVDTSTNTCSVVIDEKAKDNILWLDVGAYGI